MRRPNHDRPPLPGHGQMEDYTGAFLVSAGCVLFMALFAIWALLGFLAALFSGYSTDRAISRLGRAIR